jgi:hypothetical protein
MYIY